MVYSVNQKNNPYQQQMTMGMSSDSSGNNGVPMGVGSSGVHDDLINNSPTVKGVVHGERKWLTWALFAPVWAAMIYPMNKFNDACKGDFDGSLIGKVSKWAEDKGNNKFFQADIFKSIGNKWTGLKTKFMEFVPKSRILHAIFHTPTKPESHVVAMMAGGTWTELAADAAQKLDMLSKRFPAKEQQAELLKTMGVSAELFKNMTERSHDYAPEILEVCERLGKTDFDRFTHDKVGQIPFTKGKYFSEVIPGAHKILDTDVHFSAYANKMKAIRGANKTWLGKFTPKAMLRTIEGVTNGTAGGKLAIGMAAYFIADSIKDAINAPKGDKISTFAESNIHGLGFYLLMPLMIGLMHRVGGLKYLGMSKDQVKLYKDKIEAFDKEAQRLAGVGTKDAKASWKSQRKALIKDLKQMLKGDTVDKNAAKLAINGSGATKTLKKIFYWPIKKLAGALTFGLDTPKGFYKADAHFWEKLFASPGIALKKFAGYPLRFAMVTMIISPYFINPILKVSHMIFGKPAKSVLDDGKEPEKPKTPVNRQPRPVIMPQRAPQPVLPQPTYNLNAPLKRENLLDKYKQEHAAPVVQAVPEAPVMVPVQQPNAQMYASAQPPQPLMTVQQPNTGMYAQYAQPQQAMYQPQQMMPNYQNYANMYNQYQQPQQVAYQPQQMMPAYQNYAAYAPYQQPQQMAYQPQQVMPMYQPQQVMPSYQMPANVYMQTAAAPAMMPMHTEQARTYVPSSAGVVVNPNIQFQENLKANEAFLKADRAEKKAMGHAD